MRQSPVICPRLIYCPGNDNNRPRLRVNLLLYHSFEFAVHSQIILKIFWHPESENLDHYQDLQGFCHTSRQPHCPFSVQCPPF